jgi:hypothetical protein
MGMRTIPSLEVRTPHRQLTTDHRQLPWNSCRLSVGSCQWDRTVAGCQRDCKRLLTFGQRGSSFRAAVCVSGSLRILRNESNLANDHENENDSKFGGATPHRQLTTDHRQLPWNGCRLSAGLQAASCVWLTRFFLPSRRCVCGRYAF